MAVSQDFTDLVLERLAPLGDVRARKMFGGVGVSCDGMNIAILADDALFLKVDAETRAAFEAAGLEPFTYEKKDGERAVMAYYQVPEDVFDDPDAAMEWGRLALDAALRAAAKKKPKKKKA
ncbi:MAG: TfoX/Sxy family protein [Pseudomonadota bacterium]